MKREACDMVGGILNIEIESFKLVPGDHGKFHVTIDGELVTWHRYESDAHIFPDLQDLMRAIEVRLEG